MRVSGINIQFTSEIEQNLIIFLDLEINFYIYSLDKTKYITVN